MIKISKICFEQLRKGRCITNNIMVCYYLFSHDHRTRGGQLVIRKIVFLFNLQMSHFRKENIQIDTNEKIQK
jgi:hypothetical protein